MIPTIFPKSFAVSFDTVVTNKMICDAFYDNNLTFDYSNPEYIKIVEKGISFMTYNDAFTIFTISNEEVMDGLITLVYRFDLFYGETYRDYLKAMDRIAEKYNTCDE